VRRHWPEYLIEAGALGTFMLSAALFATVLEHPASPIRVALTDAALRRVFMGLAMAGTAMAIIYSPFGARSGAHMNPAVTLTFARLGRITGRDAAGYIVAQTLGGVGGLLVAFGVLGGRLADPSVNFVATLPGPWGNAAAFGAEVLIAFIQMTVVLSVSNSRHAKWTGVAAAFMVAVYISLEAPISGMSLNPARSFAPALISGSFSSLWIYLAAPLIGMVLAAELFVRRRGVAAVICAKLNHAGAGPCVFGCERRAAAAA
jgi:aquaporin Z